MRDFRTQKRTGFATPAFSRSAEAAANYKLGHDLIQQELDNNQSLAGINF